MDVHRLPPASVVLEGPTLRWWSRLTARRLGTPWVHAWLLVDAWTGIEARASGVRTFDPLARFAKLEEGRAFAVLTDPAMPDYDRQAIGDAAQAMVGHGYGWLEWLSFALFRRIAGGQRGRVVCSRLITAAWEAALGSHPLSGDLGPTLGARDRRRGYCVPGDLLYGTGLRCIAAAPGVGVGPDRLPLVIEGVNPWADRYPVASPRPAREAA